MLGFFYGDIVGLEGTSGLRSDQPGRMRVGKEDEFNTALAQQAPPQAPAAPAPAAGDNGDRPAEEPSTPLASEGAEAGAGGPAPCEGAVPRLAASKPGRQQRMKNKASMSLSKIDSKSLLARFEHSRAQNKQF